MASVPFSDGLGLVGERLGPYVVRQVATAGGVAVIYRGEHEALHNAVAIKVLTPEVVVDSVRPTLEQMFLREAQILSQLRSDDILRALDHGRIVCPADGMERPYIVVDWMDGKPLSEDIERRRIESGKSYTLTEAIETLEPIARALACAHASGIVHRDVNPRNVFLENVGPGRRPRAKLIDFGFAKEVARTEALRLQNVDGTLFARSPDYAAPEHYDRETYGELSENTDIYTFALMLVEMLTLEPPLRGATDAELQKATSDRSDRPTPNRRGAHVSDAVEKLFTEALAVDQFERPGVLLDWWERLKSAALGGAVVPEPPPRPPSDVSGPSIEVSGSTDASGPSIEVGPSAGVSRSGIGSLGPDDAEFAVFEAPGSARRRPRFVLLVTLASLALAFAGVVLGWHFVRRLGPLACPAGFGDCNGGRDDGCETDVRKDSAHCGSCGHACGSGESCAEGTCQKSRCPLEHLRDCNQVASDGCEVDVRTDSKNCGECGHVCGATGAKQAACINGACDIACRPGFGDCDGAPANGCEATFSTDVKNCGRCGFACTNAACTDGVCAPKMLVSPLDASHLVVENDALYFWNADERRIERVTAEGLRGTTIEHADDVFGVVVAGDRVFWSTGGKNEVFSRSLDGGTPLRVAGPLASPSPLFLSSNGYLTWSNRARAVESPKPGPKPLRAAAVLGPPPSPRAIFTVLASGAGDKARPASAECNQWPAAFVGGLDGQYCCDRNQPVTLVECKGVNCAYRPLDAKCPDVFADDGGRIYFAEETRVVILDRKTEKISTLSRRKRQPRAVTLGGEYVYWLEGEPLSDVYRIKKDATDAASVEMIARRQIDASELAAGEHAVFWTARAPADATAGTLAKRPTPAKGKSGTLSRPDPKAAPRALYGLALSGD